MKFTPKPTVLPPPLLDVGEGWACVIGLKAVLSSRVEKITEAQFREAAKIHETITKRAKSLVNGSIVPAQIAIVDYPKVLEQTSHTFEDDEAQIVAMISALPPNDQGPYLACARRQFQAIQKVIPKLTYSTLAGDQALTPDLSELTDFSDFCALLHEPLVAPFGAIAGGTFHRGMAEAFRAVFPTLSAAIDSAIDEAKTARVVKDRNFTFPWKVEIGLGAWMGQPEAVPLPSAPPPPPAEGEPGSEDADRDALTPSERIESAA